KLSIPRAESRAALIVLASIHRWLSACESANEIVLVTPWKIANVSTQPGAGTTLMTHVPRLRPRGSDSSRKTIASDGSWTELSLRCQGCGPVVAVEPCHSWPFMPLALE